MRTGILCPMSRADSGESVPVHLVSFVQTLSPDTTAAREPSKSSWELGTGR